MDNIIFIKKIVPSDSVYVVIISFEYTKGVNRTRISKGQTIKLQKDGQRDKTPHRQLHIEKRESHKDRERTQVVLKC